MNRSLRAGLALGTALLFAAQPALAAQPARWPQAASDLRADPAVRFGVLPNGMRYAIRKQSIPPGQASLRLRIDAGAMMETDAQQGLAHFLEHMAFNGSKNVKEGEMTKMLERLGLAFGPDTNASTGFGETIYMLELPKTDPETVDTSLMLMRESASNLLIEQPAVDRERGVVLSEERARDTPGYRIVKERLAFWLKGQRLPQRMPIGKVEVLKTAPAAQVADFYHRYYRPERAVFVAVGDFDVDAMEAKIRARFSDWKGVGPAGADPEQGKVAPRGPEAKLMVEPGAQLSLQIAWVAKPDLSPDTEAKRKRDLVESLALATLNRRYSRLARGANPPFIGATAYTFQQEDEADVAVVSVAAEPGRWAEAMAAAEQEQRRALTYGIRQDELDREITEMRALLRTAVAGANTRRQAELANEIVASLDDDQVVTAPADDLALFEEAVKGLTAATASAALKSAFHGGGPLVFMATPKPVEGGDAALMAAFQASQKTPVQPPAEASAVSWPYESFGPPGQVAERREVADMGATFIRFANGVRLTVKPTKFRDDEVLVRVNVGDGLLDLSSTRQSPSWAASALVEGGLKKIETDDMERVLADKVFGARFGLGDDAFVFSGSTRPGDLPTQMQVLAAYVAEPGFRDEAFQRLKTAGKTIHDQFESTDSGVLSRDLSGLLHGGDRRWTFPSREEIASAKLSDLTGQVAPHLADGRIEVVIVGDITVDQALAATATTFGALPARPEAPAVPEAAKKVAFPKGGGAPLVLTHKGRADQSIGYVAWPTTDYWADPQRARETAVMSEVLSLRLLDELREAQGATYSPNVGVNHSMVWQGWGYVAASVEVPPEKLPAFFDDVAKIVADLKAKPPTADELQRAKSPRLERLQKARVTNQYWLAELSGAQFEPRRLETIRETIAGTQKVTADDVQRAARTWLKDETAFKLIVRPEAGQPK
ncbi:M16 family metallopeptidase [Phenylobacterium sp. VNQ135]|uniref:M16 family metallopeptidase n=1 Tax=Phenylobacterium sp. VNQ135 TaxID=3400922 RepID=UPI003C124EC2